MRIQINLTKLFYLLLFQVSRLSLFCWVSFSWMSWRVLLVHLLLPQPIRRHDTQHNDIQHNDTQHKGLICDTKNNNALPLCWVLLSLVSHLFIVLPNAIMLECRYGECSYAECCGAANTVTLLVSLSIWLFYIPRK